MGTAYSARQSSYTQGDTINADDSNDEFDAILAAFGTSGHSHDGTAGEGGAIAKLLSNTLTFGAATSGTDITITFDGESNDGVLAWMEDEDYFKFSDDILINSTEKIMFGDTASFIHQSSDGVLTIDGEATIDLNASTAVLVSNDLKLNSDAAVLGFGADNDVTLTHVADTGLLLNSTMAIQFNDASQYINAPSATVLDINATDEVEVNATLMDVNANLDVSGTYTGGGLMTTGGNIVIPDGGNIGSASDTDAIAISSGGVVTFSQTPVFSSDLTLGDDLYLDSDAAVIHFGDDGDVTLTHVADTGLLLNSTMALQFNDASQYINAPSATILDINATDEIELNATLVDVNANLDVSGTYTGGGLMTTGGNIVIPDAGNIGSASDTDAIAISSGGVVTMNQIPVFSAGINVSGGTIAGTLATAAQGNVTSLGTLTTLTVDNVIINGTTIGHTSDTDLLTLTSGVLTVAGELDATTLDISGNADIDGTTNLDAVDIDGAVQIDNTVTVGVDDTGYDVKFFGDTASAYMLWDASTDDLILGGASKMGIGTTSPGAKLEIAGDYQPLIVNSTTSSVAKIILEDNGTTSGYLGAASGYPFIIGRASDAANQFQFKDLNGYSKLNFAASTTAGGGAGGAYLQAFGSNAASPPQIAGIDLSMTDGTDGSESGIIAFHTTNSGTSGERMRIDSSGNVGIGTASPDTELHITASGVSMTFENQNAQKWSIGQAVVADEFTIRDETGTANRFHIDGSGNVGIGTTSPTNKLEVVGTQKTTSQIFVGSASDDNYSGGIINLSNTSRSFNLSADPNNAGASTFMSFSTDGSERTRIDAQGRLLIGTTTGPYNVPLVAHTGATAAPTAGNNNASAMFTNVTSGQNAEIGIIAHTGQQSIIDFGDTSDYDVGRILYDHTSNYLAFRTAAAERMRINSSTLRPGADNSQSLGDASYRWSEVFAGNGTINTSDQREKTEIADLDEAERRVAIALKGLVKKYRFKDAVAAKGDNARIHVGVIAQEVVAAFSVEGLDATKYALLCHDEWDAVEAKVNDDGEVVTPGLEAGDRYGIRYDQLLAFIISAL